MVRSISNLAHRIGGGLLVGDFARSAQLQAAGSLNPESRLRRMSSSLFGSRYCRAIQTAIPRRRISDCAVREMPFRLQLDASSPLPRRPRDLRCPNGRTSVVVAILGRLGRRPGTDGQDKIQVRCTGRGKLVPVFAAKSFSELVFLLQLAQRHGVDFVRGMTGFIEAPEPAAPHLID